MDYLVIKTLHILSAILLFGTGLGSAFYKLLTDRQGDLAAIAATNRLVVIADWVFTTPAVIVQPLTGIYLARLAGWPLTSGWLMASIGLYVVAGLCWLPVVVMQIRMRNLASRALETGLPLPPGYHRMMRAWILLGIPAFCAMVITVALMVLKPAL